MNKLTAVSLAFLLSTNIAQAALIKSEDQPIGTPFASPRDTTVKEEFEHSDSMSELPVDIPSSIQDQALASIKTGYAKVTNEIISIINGAQSAIDTIPIPEDASCQTDSSIQEIEEYLISQNEKIQNAKSLSEIKTLITSTVNYLKENKDNITDTVTGYVDCAYNATLSIERSYLNAAKAQANVLKIKGQDTSDVLDDIFAAMALTDQSEDIFLNASTEKDKAEAYKVLSDTVPYLKSINEALYA